MNIVTRPPSDSNGVGHAGDDLDEVLSAYFKSQLPAAWPRPKLGEARRLRPAQPAPAPSRRAWFRSPRFALAASVALLIAASAILSAGLTAPAPADGRAEQGEHSAKGHGPKAGAAVEDDRVDMSIESLEQVGNNPTTINIKVFKNK
jgi:hypothetical protein